jgi:ATP-dependent DNA helicase DinG
MNDILPFFPLSELRPKQVKACEFIQRKVEEGFKDIVVAAPTGIGKSAIGVNAAFWIASHFPTSGVTRGAYYLVTQKLLQDQITDDIPRYKECCRNSFSIKTSEEYPCPDFTNCGTGRRLATTANRILQLPEERRATIPKELLDKKTRKCHCLAEGTCAYQVAKSTWLGATLSVTNYAFFFTSRMYTNDIASRQMLICDECHSLEEQIIRFVDGAVSVAQAKKWTGWDSIPNFDSLYEYCSWLEKIYVPKLVEVYHRLEELEILADISDEKTSKDLTDLDKYICKLNRAINQIKDNEDNWVFWKEDSRDGNDRQYVIRPVFGRPFVQQLIKSIAPIRLYLSAYPGIPDVFCRNLGLEQDKVAWLTLGSDFPVKHRQIHYYPMGSMGNRSKSDSLPTVLRSVIRIAKAHETSRGLIHCNSYELGEQIQNALATADQCRQVIFPKNADEREEAFRLHNNSENSVLISPSMREGFDFAGDKARWQIIAKCPWPYLGDKQVARKLELDPDWYQMKTVMDLIQACGRICRSKDDWGVTFILDSDFQRIWDKNSWMLPQWYKDAVVFHGK